MWKQFSFLGFDICFKVYSPFYIAKADITNGRLYIHYDRGNLEIKKQPVTIGITIKEV